MKESKKLFPARMIFTAAVLLLLFAAGILIGSWYLVFLDGAPDLLFDQASGKDIDFTTIFSQFLFEHVFYLTITFLFGLTFLGVAVVPLAAVLKGITVGISFSYLLISEEISVYFAKWIAYLPSAFCIAVFLLFSAYAFGVSLKFCSFLRCKGAAPISLKGYGFLFVFSLFILAAAGGLHCVLNLLPVILF